MRVVTGSPAGIVAVWDAPSISSPVPSWFLTLAEGVAGRRLSARGSAEFVFRRELEDSVQQLAQAKENGFYERLARWFLADPAQRPVSPF